MKKILLVTAVVMLTLVVLNVYRISLVDKASANTSTTQNSRNSSSQSLVSTSSTSSFSSSTNSEESKYINPLDKKSCEGYILVRGFTSLHDGIDLATGVDNCIVVSSTSGLVTQAGWVNGGGGWQVTVKTSQNTEVIYSHLAASGLFVTEGQKISEGTPLGIMGMSGRATGRHLHLTIKENGKEVDPLKYINIK